MKIIFFSLWLITIVPPSAVYLTGFTAGSLALTFLRLASQFKD